MKNGFFKTSLFYLVFIIFLTACSKNKEEPSSVVKINDFVGQWKGLFPYNGNNDPSTAELRASLATYAENSILTGFMKTPDGILIIDNKVFLDGVYTFSIRNNSFDNPDCQSWDVTGSANLYNEFYMGVNFGGIFCGVHPKDITGTMTKELSIPDTTVLLTMAAAGRKMIYSVTDSEGISFDQSTEFQKDLANGVWRILTTKTKGQQSPKEVSYQFITPVEWGQLPDNDSTPSHQQTNYRIDAKTGIKYITVTATDSIIVTIVSLDEMVTVPAGTFKCIKLARENKPIAPGGSEAFSKIWINNNTGIIKSLKYKGDSLVKTTLLKEKNF